MSIFRGRFSLHAPSGLISPPLHPALVPHPNVLVLDRYEIWAPQSYDDVPRLPINIDWFWYSRNTSRVQWLRVGHNSSVELFSWYYAHSLLLRWYFHIERLKAVSYHLPGIQPGLLSISTRTSLIYMLAIVPLRPYRVVSLLKWSSNEFPRVIST